MTAEKLHDALTLLPADLIAETDKKRSRKPNVIVWKRYAAMAACFALVLGCGWYVLQMLGGMGGLSAAKTESAVMQAAPMMGAADEAMPEAAPEEMPAENGAGENENTLSRDHAHTTMEPAEIPSSQKDWRGNMTATVYAGENTIVLTGSDAVTLTDILDSLDYREEELCRCMAEYIADTEMGSGYEINLTESFVRYQGGQAALTQEQAAQLQAVLESAKE